MNTKHPQRRHLRRRQQARSRSAALRRGAEIVVACPGRLLDHVGDGTIDLRNVEVLVLDEADHMFDMGFLPDVRRILRAVPADRSRRCSSRPPCPTKSARWPDGILTDPADRAGRCQRARPRRSRTPSTRCPRGSRASCSDACSTQTETGRVLIFTRTKRRARNIAEELERNGLQCGGAAGQHGAEPAPGGHQRLPLRASIDILVATDIAARGIDVTGISHVINYDMPDTVDAYTHRIGRTGRAHAIGEAFTFVVHEDESMVRDIERVLGSRIERRRHPISTTAASRPSIWQPRPCRLVARA